MKIAIIGGTGLFGSNLVKLLSNYDVKAFSRKESDNIKNNLNVLVKFDNLESKLSNYFTTWTPDIIINTIALVDLQKCENDLNLANFSNCEIAIKIAEVSKKFNSYLIHISTDHYYNDLNVKHKEEDAVNLLNNYSKSKYKAEVKILNIYKKSLIVRTNIIGFRRNDKESFFEWLVNSLEKNENINLYSNFFTSPISVNILGKLLIKCYEKELVGIYNISSCETISKYDFGIKVAERFSFDKKNIKKTRLEEDNNNLKRALTLGLNTSKIEKSLGLEMPKIEEVIDSLYNEYK